MPPAHDQHDLLRQSGCLVAVEQRENRHRLAELRASSPIDKALLWVEHVVIVPQVCGVLSVSCIERRLVSKLPACADIAAAVQRCSRHLRPLWLAQRRVSAAIDARHRRPQPRVAAAP